MSMGTEGTDMSGMSAMGGGSMGGAMKPWLHFTRGDTLYFQGWVPGSAGAVVGACFGLFLLAVIERWVAAICAIMQSYWGRKTYELLVARSAKLREGSIKPDLKYLGDKDIEVESLHTKHTNPTSLGRVVELRRTLPFIPTYDIGRGIVHASQTALRYALMLAVMTFNAGYIISIIAGAGVGEILFGRFGASAHHH